jgi:hypothetical protein
MSMDLETRIATLEAKVEYLEKGRSGRKPKPILCSVEGICGVDPTIDSSTCPDASLYRRQQGCQGAACTQKSSEYYSAYRAQRDRDRKSKLAKRIIKRKR